MVLHVLIRTSFRPVLFKRCLDSLLAQSFKNIHIIVSYDDDRALSYIPKELQKIRVQKNGLAFGFDNYCNELKALVTNGWLWFLDDDEVLVNPNSLDRVSRYFPKRLGIICQFSRGELIKPSNELMQARSIKRGKIGMPCFFLHHSVKDLADFDGSKPAADYHYIKAISRKVKLKFLPIVVVHADQRGNGSMED